MTAAKSEKGDFSEMLDVSILSDYGVCRVQPFSGDFPRKPQK